eukprot:208625-Chlamydomonas_euryale.AAC.1
MLQPGSRQAGCCRTLLQVVEAGGQLARASCGGSACSTWRTQFAARRQRLHHLPCCAQHAERAMCEEASKFMPEHPAVLPEAPPSLPETFMSCHNPCCPAKKPSCLAGNPHILPGTLAPDADAGSLAPDADTSAGFDTASRRKCGGPVRSL